MLSPKDEDVLISIAIGLKGIDAASSTQDNFGLFLAGFKSGMFQAVEMLSNGTLEKATDILLANYKSMRDNPIVMMAALEGAWSVFERAVRSINEREVSDPYTAKASAMVRKSVELKARKGKANA